MSKKGMAWLQYAEPARLRAVWIALVSLLAALGITLGTDVDGAVGAVIAAISVILPLVQGEWTRGAVYSPKTYEEDTQAAETGDPIDTPKDPYNGEPG